VRPLRGIVRADKTIACENGLSVLLELPDGVRPSDTVLVCYDFNTMRAISVMKEVEDDAEGEENSVEPVSECEFVPGSDCWDYGSL